MNKSIVRNGLYVVLILAVLFAVIYYKFPNIYNKMVGSSNNKEGFQTMPPRVRDEIMRQWKTHIKIPTESPRTTESPTTKSA